MTTATQIIVRAFRKSGIGQLGEALDAESLSEGLDALNAMMAAWKLSGVDITHTALDYEGTFPLGAEYEEGTVYLLASRLNPSYQIPDAFDADAWFRTFQAAYFTVAEVALPKAMQMFPSQRTRLHK